MKPVPEYIKVRSYIYNLVLKSDGGSVRIPSENELCELFNVSRVTVRGALKALVDDRILITRRGMGTYVNPKYISEFSYPRKIIGTIRESGELALNQLSVMIADAVEKNGMYLELLFRPDSKQPGRLAEQARNLDGVIWENYSRKDGRKYAEAFAENHIPFLLLAREKELEHDSILLNTRNEAHQVVRAASGAGHRKILFVHRDSKERLRAHKNPGFTYYHVREELLSLASDSVCDICTFHDFSEMLNEKKSFQYTMLYFSFTLARNVMEALDQHGIRVPEDVSCLVYGKSDPRFFHGLEPDSIDFRQPMENLIGNWFEKRIFCKETSGTFQEELFPELVSGQTIRKMNQGNSKIQCMPDTHGKTAVHRGGHPAGKNVSKYRRRSHG